MTALETLIAWGDEMLKQHPNKILSFAEAIDKAQELLEMEKQQIIDAHISGYDSSGGSAEDYYQHYYGSKGSDGTLNSSLNSTLNSSSQTEISDEEIEKAADKYVSEDEFNRLLECFKKGAKWYREQLRKTSAEQEK